MSRPPGGPRAPDAAYDRDPRVAPQIPQPNPFNHYESESDLGDYPSRRNTYASDLDAQGPYYDQHGGYDYCKCHIAYLPLRFFSGVCSVDYDFCLEGMRTCLASRGMGL